MFKKSGKEIFAAAFLMATSAIGPGFLTQTTVFTEKLLYNFGFIIVVSILIDVVAQVTIWRTLTFSNLKAQQLGNILLPDLGNLLAVCVAFGGLVFNIGNFAGAGMGINAMLDIPNEWGIIITAVIVFYLFYSKNNLEKLDYVIRILGILMLVLILIMLLKAKVDFAKLVEFSVIPEVFDIKSTITLVGGTVGGYITFAGAQRLMDAGMVGEKYSGEVAKSASIGIIFTGVLRYFLFIGTLSIVLAGVSIDANNPTSSVFMATFGSIGKILFGLMIWAASITSVIGATYTSVAFLKDFHPIFEQKNKIFALIFVLISVLAILIFGKPVNLLLFAGYINGFILPVGLAIVLLSIRNKKIFSGFNYPVLLQLVAWVIVVVLAGFAVYSLF
ncbi:NRAMP family divalent metal transporter [Lacihabitans soyangensis]|uniref:Divalent metal cation transporter n=1 Tax=Lacihabitans soyangensis TaxID=869394 RepID=A0AAE3KTK1_9BACT|nr:divalent metal cation transporter [Lacihabitans soyangensis]MCP9764527.1 divalent metal cation transporter [Lacihabitans soyangensis]